MHRIHESPTPLCPCRLGEQTAKLVLQDCPEYCELSKKYWPIEVTINQRLYGTNVDFNYQSSSSQGQNWRYRDDANTRGRSHEGDSHITDVEKEYALCQISPLFNIYFMVMLEIIEQLV